MRTVKFVQWQEGEGWIGYLLDYPDYWTQVDTGSELTWIPAETLKSVGITPRRKRVFETATQHKIEREVGYAILSVESYETNDEVVFAEPGDMTLLGVRTLEGFGVMVDDIGHRFVATTTIVAASDHS